jgi:hypothetical protein
MPRRFRLFVSAVIVSSGIFAVQAVAGADSSSPKSSSSLNQDRSLARRSDGVKDSGMGGRHEEMSEDMAKMRQAMEGMQSQMKEMARNCEKMMAQMNSGKDTSQ